MWLKNIHKQANEKREVNKMLHQQSSKKKKGAQCYKFSSPGIKVVTQETLKSKIHHKTKARFT